MLKYAISLTLFLAACIEPADDSAACDPAACPRTNVSCCEEPEPQEDATSADGSNASCHDAAVEVDAGPADATERDPLPACADVECPSMGWICTPCGDPNAAPMCTCVDPPNVTCASECDGPY